MLLQSLELVTNVAISEVGIREKGGKDWVVLKESSTNTCTIKSEAPLKGPFSVRFLVKNGGYRVVDDLAFKVSEGSSDTSLELVTNVSISEVEVKENGGKYWVGLKESSTNTWTLKSEALSIRFLVKNGSYHVIDNVTFKVGEGSSGTSLELVTNVAISEVEIKEKGGKDWVALKESSTNTWAIKSETPLKGPFSVRFLVKNGGYRVVDDSEAALKGPFSVRFLVKNGGYRVVDDVIPESFTAGSEYKSGINVRRMGTANTTSDCCSTASSSLASKGHNAVYTADGARFEVPLVYLGIVVFGELLAMSQEEFGFAGNNGRIMLTCDASEMEYVMCLISIDASEEVERAFLSSMASSCHSVGGISHPVGERRAVRDWLPWPAEVGLHAAVGGGATEEVVIGVDAAILEREVGGVGLGGDGVLLAAEGEAHDDVATLEDSGGVAEDEPWEGLASDLHGAPHIHK
uniref:Expansin-like CBD domain-containing protein n=1 Tax=Oryza meridionalis TaxID=40149 RepID=A0A0E0E4V2_9ORYZ